MAFFDQYPRFYTTSQTSPQPIRLNARHQAIIEQHIDLFKNKRVLDIGSHDGRWSFAAIKAGASHVKGIEPREHLVTQAQNTFRHYEIESSKYHFECGDIFQTLKEESYDIVLCLGFFYHTHRHIELLDKIERTGAKLVVLDTEVTPLSEEQEIQQDEDVLATRSIFCNPYKIQLLIDPVNSEQMAFSEPTTRKGLSIVGRPSRAALNFMAHHFSFQVDSFKWDVLIKEFQHPIES